MKGAQRNRAALIGIALVGLVLASACALSPGSMTWGAELTETERNAVLEAVSAEAARELVPLSEIFYARITSRRFNSRATFEDPSVRQFFPTVAAYSDYYAALVDALDRAYIRFNRPTSVELLGIEVAVSGNLMLKLRFVGRNDLPLRWWNASLILTDEWTWQDGRWFVVPGKV
ncbi:MAG: hypothetical protein GY910_11095 [bacterium]|nr:hypothetical protein [Deltaproteobacteria bacterium]MCP4905515.1 hypothetical protein [bacterium]